jgi:hypothetical protein
MWLFGIARNMLAGSARRGRVESAARRRIGLDPLVLRAHHIELIEELVASEGDAIVAAWLAELPDDEAHALQARGSRPRAPRSARARSRTAPAGSSSASTGSRTRAGTAPNDPAAGGTAVTKRVPHARQRTSGASPIEDHVAAALDGAVREASLE